MKSLHFGVECPACGSGILTVIPSEWVAHEYSDILRRLVNGMGLEAPEANIESAENIVEFFQLHQPHGAAPSLCEIEEAPEEIEDSEFGSPR